MKYAQTFIPDVWIIEPVVYNDARGYFFEAYKQPEFEAHTGPVRFMQDNESSSVRGVLRGLHYQLAPWSQAKLVRVIQGRVLDVAVDIRRGSPAFGRYVSVELSDENRRQLFIPKGFAHGFYVMSETAVFTYKVDCPYMPAHERSIRFDDPAIGIDLTALAGNTPVMSAKDRQAPLLADAEINFEYDK
ncbi:MAG: dTDP-4-dehydrorhamnose 3,5-epimerase [Tannerella sp.]|jgi:dTDP-4-dehydrorhamnose 3,5-epimerase|nr:dTDP-4-dehydrorhamnose 3,5-epimerase [Tannerella sp.]